MIGKVWIRWLTRKYKSARYARKKKTWKHPDLSPMQHFEALWKMEDWPSRPDDRYILTVIDVLTRKGIARVIKNETSNHVINALEDVLLKEVNPKEMLADNGKEFISNEFRIWCENRNIKLKHGTLYTPTTGAIERFNKTSIGKLRNLSFFWGKCLGKKCYNSQFKGTIFPHQEHWEFHQRN